MFSLSRYNREHFHLDPRKFCFNLNLKQAKLNIMQLANSYCTHAKSNSKFEKHNEINEK